MILGLSDTEKKFKTAMDTAGADMTVVNSWLKLYVKTKKNSSGVAKRYYGVKTGLSSLLSDLKELEQQVIGYCELTGTDRKHFGELIKACKAKSGMFDDEFLISKVDTAGADMTVVNSWLKLYVKTKKNSSGVAKRYYGVKTGLSSLLSDLKELEQQVIGYCELTGTDRKHFGELIKACKAKSGMFDDEFLISKVDTDFHTTLDSVVKQGERYLSSFDNGIILQSEIENLIHLTNEGLERKKPDLFALSYFYLGHSNKELAELNFTQKTKRVHEIYYEEFWKDILKQLEACVKQAEAINDKYEGTTDRRTARILSELNPLLVGVTKQWEPEQTAEYILRDMCRIFRD